MFNAYDVDIVYNVFGAIHTYLAPHYGRNGANGNGELGVNGYNYTAANVYLDTLPGNGMGCTYAGYNTSYGYVGICHAVTVPDAIAHEYAHGITFSVREMTYYGQSGALDESYSDVFGEIFEKSFLGATDWCVGSGAIFLRSLKDPGSSAGAPLPGRFNSPDVYCGGGDNGGVHWNSTILSHAGYLLAEGAGTNGPFNGCTIQAIGMGQMEQVMYRANVFYYSASESFNGAYLDWIQASTDLYGAASETTRQVTRALQAVELDQPGRCSGLPARLPQATDVEGW